MRTYLIRRVSLLVPTIIAITIVLFGLLRLVPGDAATATLSRFDQTASTEDIAALRDQLGLSDPLWRQYVDWVAGLAQGDFGSSLVTRRPISEELSGRVAVTIELSLLAAVLSCAIGLPFGVLSAIYRDKWLDVIIRTVAIAGLSIPGFWIATMIIVFGSLWFGWAPPVQYVSIGEDFVLNMKQFLVPASITAIALAAPQMRVMRSSMLDVLGEDYIRTASAKGLSGRSVVISHAMKNAMIPVLTVIGIQVALVVGGTVIMEQIFGLPGLGSYLLSSISQRDYPAVQTVNLFFALFVLMVNIIVDISYGALDPRVRYS